MPDVKINFKTLIDSMSIAIGRSIKGNQGLVRLGGLSLTHEFLQLVREQIRELQKLEKKTVAGIQAITREGIAQRRRYVSGASAAREINDETYRFYNEGFKRITADFIRGLRAIQGHLRDGREQIEIGARIPRENINRWRADIDSLIAVLPDPNAEGYDKKFSFNIQFGQKELAAALGAGIIDASQGLDLLLGAQVIDSGVKKSDGDCAGLVLDWAEQWIEGDSEPTYPLVITTQVQDYQENQHAVVDDKTEVKYNESVLNYSSSAADGLFNFLEQLEPGDIYYIRLDPKGYGGAHAIGLRKKYNGGYELFDPNCGCISFADVPSLRLWLEIFLQHYSLSRRLSEVTCYKFKQKQKDFASDAAESSVAISSDLENEAVRMDMSARGDALMFACDDVLLLLEAKADKMFVEYQCLRVFNTYMTYFDKAKSAPWLVDVLENMILRIDSLLKSDEAENATTSLPKLRKLFANASLVTEALTHLRDLMYVRKEALEKITTTAEFKQYKIFIETLDKLKVGLREEIIRWLNESDENAQQQAKANLTPDQKSELEEQGFILKLRIDSLKQQLETLHMLGVKLEAALAGMAGIGDFGIDDAVRDMTGAFPNHADESAAAEAFTNKPILLVKHETLKLLFAFRKHIHARHATLEQEFKEFEKVIVSADKTTTVIYNRGLLLSKINRLSQLIHEIDTVSLDLFNDETEMRETPFTGFLAFNKQVIEQFSAATQIKPDKIDDKLGIDEVELGKFAMLYEILFANNQRALISLINKHYAASVENDPDNAGAYRARYEVLQRELCGIRETLRNCMLMLDGPKVTAAELEADVRRILSISGTVKSLKDLDRRAMYRLVDAQFTQCIADWKQPEYSETVSAGAAASAVAWISRPKLALTAVPRIAQTFAGGDAFMKKIEAGELEGDSGVKSRIVKKETLLGFVGAGTLAGRTPLVQAMAYKQDEIVSFFLQFPITAEKLGKKTVPGNTALHSACEYELHADTLRQFFEYVKENKEEKLLLETNVRGRTPFQMAFEQANVTAMEVMAEVFSPDEYLQPGEFAQLPDGCLKAKLARMILKCESDMAACTDDNTDSADGVAPVAADRGFNMRQTT